MNFHNVLTHHPERAITQPHFFILSKGKNAGKPLKECCPIAYFLWKANFWHQYQIGSVIPFIRITIFKSCFRDEVLRAYKQHQKHLEFVNRIRQLEALQNHYSKTVEQIEKLK